jgi:hypothetical protein
MAFIFIPITPKSAYVCRRFQAPISSSSVDSFVVVSPPFQSKGSHFVKRGEERRARQLAEMKKIPLPNLPQNALIGAPASRRSNKQQQTLAALFTVVSRRTCR